MLSINDSKYSWGLELNELSFYLQLMHPSSFIQNLNSKYDEVNGVLID